MVVNRCAMAAQGRCYDGAVHNSRVTPAVIGATPR
jgi:hypothetical protein